MPTLLMLKGLPASGKSTYARELVQSKGYTRVNKDDLRSMLHAGKWGKANEKQVLMVRDLIIQDALGFRKLNVVVDDTNFAPKHEAAFREMAKKCDAKFEVKFFDTAIEECIKRDLSRENSVGERVIRDMYNQFLKPPVEVYVPPQDKPEAIICDIDGTLAHMTAEGRLRFGKQAPFMWANVGEDTLDETVATIIRIYRLCLPDVRIILLSGRDGVCRPETKQWLRDNDVFYHELIMRAKDDNRKDSIIKRELFDERIRDNYRVLFILDDRDQVVEMWRQMGIKVLQVAEGAF